MRIDDALLDALADRWPNIPCDWPGQTFEVWLERRLSFYNEFGYPLSLNKQPLWFDNFPPSLWDLVRAVPPADSDDAYLDKPAEDLRQKGGTFIQRVRDLRPLARYILSMGV